MSDADPNIMPLTTGLAKAMRGEGDERTLHYIAETASSIAGRITRDLDNGYQPTRTQIAEDVAWIARSLARLALIRPSAARDTLTGSSDE